MKIFFQRGHQTVSWFTKIFQTIVWSGYVIIGLIVVLTRKRDGGSVINLLDYVYIFSYVKLVITILKYIPQVYS